MFTGIVEELGSVVAIEPLPAEGARLRVAGPLVTSDVHAGDSIAVNGVCLTVVDPATGEFSADVMAETLRRSTLGGLAPGSRVNLERAMPADGRFGGHVVQGHVDGVGRVVSRGASAPEGTASPGAVQWDTVAIAVPADLARYIVPKGSITVDGVSLTVSAVREDGFEVSLIPTTLASTTLGLRAVGDPVNLEVDVLAKYVERILEATQ